MFLEVVKMLLTNENYYNQEANQEYMSVSQYKDFCGTLGKPACESLALAKLSGEWEEQPSKAMLVGSYVDSHFEGTLDVFKAQNPSIFTQKGDLRAEYKKAEEVINRIERDKLFMESLSGEKQVIMTAELFGVKWKIKMDSYIKDKCIVDLKVMASLRDSKWTKDYGHMEFVRYWGYDIQGAIYQEVVYQSTGKRLPFYIAGASKEDEPDIELIYIDDNHLKDTLCEVEQNISKVVALKNSEIEPIRCGICKYCRHTKVLTHPIHFTEIVGEI